MGQIGYDTTSFNLGAVISIDLNDAISYNSVVELNNVWSRSNPSYERLRLDETALIACALKSRKIYIVMLIPNGSQQVDESEQI